jgi:hypothetical protein
MLNFFKKIFGYLFRTEKNVEAPVANTLVIHDGKYVLSNGESVEGMKNVQIMDIEVDDFDENTNIIALELTLSSQIDKTSLKQDMYVDRQTFERLIMDGAETIIEDNPYRHFVKRGTEVVYFNVDSMDEVLLKGLSLNKIVSPRECGEKFEAAFKRYYGEKDVKIFLSRSVKVEDDAFSSDEDWERRIEDGIC